MSERRYLYRVRSTDAPVVHYHGRSFPLASEIFDATPGSRVLERQDTVDGWRSIIAYEAPAIWPIRDHSPYREED